MPLFCTMPLGILDGDIKAPNHACLIWMPWRCACRHAIEIVRGNAAVNKVKVACGQEASPRFREESLRHLCIAAQMSCFAG